MEIIDIIQLLEKHNYIFKYSLNARRFINHCAICFEYERELEDVDFYFNGETWVFNGKVNGDSVELFLNEYGKKWKLTEDEDINYEDLELYDLSRKESREFYDY